MPKDLQMAIGKLLSKEAIKPVYKPESNGFSAISSKYEKRLEICVLW